MLMYNLPISQNDLIKAESVSMVHRRLYYLFSWVFGTMLEGDVTVSRRAHRNLMGLPYWAPLALEIPILLGTEQRALL